MLLNQLIKQKTYEKIEYFLRRDPITFIPTVILFLILMAVPVTIYFLINSLYPQLFIGEVFFPISVLLASIYYLSVYLFCYAQFVDFYLDVWIITNDRVVDIQQNGLFARTISEIDLYRIQDVTVSVKGFFPTIFKYGDLSVKTAADNAVMTFWNIPNPNEVRSALIELAESDRKYHHEQV